MKIEINAEFFKTTGEKPIGCKVTFSRPDGKPVMMKGQTNPLPFRTLSWFEEGRDTGEAFARAVAFGLDHFFVPPEEEVK